jgi:inward rectifier potassium channel
MLRPAMPDPHGATRILQQHESRVTVVGLRRRRVRDVYHGLLTGSWLSLFLVVVIIYLGVNTLFALGYLALGDGIENAEPGSFTDAFFFSVQTMATIGYGHMGPRSFEAHVLVTAEAIIGMFSVAVVTGLVFAKFARPTARVLFSRVAVMGRSYRIPALSFRMANERRNPIVGAQLSLMLARNELTEEGEVVRRVHDLSLRRSQSALFGITWTADHLCVAGSPLAGADAESLEASDAEVIVSLTGLEEGLSQTVHAHHVYRASQIVWNARFADLLVKRKKGQRVLDFGRFHEVEPLAEPERAPSPSGRRR